MAEGCVVRRGWWAEAGIAGNGPAPARSSDPIFPKTLESGTLGDGGGRMFASGVADGDGAGAVEDDGTGLAIGDGDGDGAAAMASGNAKHIAAIA